MKLKKDKIKEFLFKTFWSIARHAFFTCLVLFLIALFFGVWFFNKTNIISKTDTFDDMQDGFLLKYKVYNKVLENWQRDQERYEQADYKEYTNPFSAQGELTEE